MAILLFSVGGLFAIYEGVHKLSEPHVIEAPIVSLVILAISIGLEGFSFAACLKEVNLQRNGQSIWKWMHKTTSSELLVILTEDAAAMLGLLIASASLLTALLTQNPLWDAAGSIAVGSVLVIVAIFLAIEIKSLIIGEAPAKDFSSFISDQIAAHFPGGKLLRIIALQMGPNEVMLSYKIHPGTIDSSRELVERINHIEKIVKQQFSEERWQFVEPDFEA